MRIFAMIACAVALSGCETLEALAPQTVAGFEAGGVLGALDGASGAILARCRRYDGAEFRVAMDVLGENTGTTGRVQSVRSERRKICATAGAVAILSARGS